MFNELNRINTKPGVFSKYTAHVLWNDPHISRKMLAYHLDENVNAASRNKAFIEKSTDWICRRFNLGADSRVLDFGCGPGLYTQGLALRGMDVTGLDFSCNSLEYARKAANESSLNISYILGDYLRFESENKFDLITMIMCDFCALNLEQRRMLLQKIHRLLEPGGSFLFDVFSVKAFEKKEENAGYEKRLMDGFWSPEDYFGFLNTFSYPEDKVSLDKYVIFESRRCWEVYNWLQYFSPESLEVELNGCGLKIVETYADVAGMLFQEDSDEFAVVVQHQAND